MYSFDVFLLAGSIEFDIDIIQLELIGNSGEFDKDPLRFRAWRVYVSPDT